MRRCGGSTHAVMNGLVLPSGWKAEAVGGEQIPHQGQVDTPAGLGPRGAEGLKHPAGQHSGNRDCYVIVRVS